jgi:phosphopantothenoylcysteine decarboxylase/phosphopantothenate--cysteine ligase
LITAGPTREMWDPIRYLSNLSSGKTGFAIAEKAREYGANVALISGIKDVKIDGVKIIYIESALDMFEAVKQQIIAADIFISAAAVSDFRPVRAEKKIKKKEDEIPVIRLERNPDILKWVGRNYPGKVIVGFSLEDKVNIDEGIYKMKEKNCKIMVLNDVRNLGSDSKSFYIINGKNTGRYNDVGLEELATVILEKCRNLIDRGKV